MIRVHDVAIIGGGTSAIFAALRLAGEGLDVAVASSGPSSALMCRGAAFEGRTFPDDPPFERLWRDVLPGMWQGQGEYVGFDGALVAAARALEGLASRDAIQGDDVLVTDVPGLPGPSARVLAPVLAGILGREVRHTTLRLQYAVSDFNLTPVQWARRFDDEEAGRVLVDHLLRLLIDDPADCVLVPPILGVASGAQVRRALDGSVKGGVLELLGGPGWPPGLRIAHALDEALRSSGVIVVPARVTAGRREGEGLAGVVTDGGTEIHAHHYLLATGGLPGGGLRLEHGLEETALGLPVFMDGRVVEAPVGELGVDPATLFGEDLASHHPVLRAGVRVDARARPVGPDGAPVLRNLRACGSVVEGCGGQAGSAVVDPGASAYSGWLAAGIILGSEA